MAFFTILPDENSSERSVSVVLDGEEAELVFVRVNEASIVSFCIPGSPFVWYTVKKI